MGQIDTDALRRIAQRVHDTATQHGAKGQVVVTKDGLRLEASARKGGSISQCDVPWDQADSLELERRAQEAFSEALQNSREANS
jgi:hypothetical protein